MKPTLKIMLNKGFCLHVDILRLSKLFLEFSHTNFNFYDISYQNVYSKSTFVCLFLYFSSRTTKSIYKTQNSRTIHFTNIRVDIPEILNVIKIKMKNRFQIQHHYMGNNKHELMSVLSLKTIPSSFNGRETAGRTAL